MRKCTGFIFTEYDIQTKNTGLHGINLMHNHRCAISLYMSKALIKSQWINTNDVYIGIKTI